MEGNSTAGKDGTGRKALEKNRLGRGLSALIPQSASRPSVDGAEAAYSARSFRLAEPGAEAALADPADHDSVREIPLSKIVANAWQPRSDFDEAGLDELAASVRAYGILQPVLVRPAAGGRFELVAGERRYRAAERAGLTAIPAVIREMTDEESLAAALVENIQREDLNAIESARGYRQLLDQFGLTQAELARQLGKSQPTIANALGLLRLPPEIQESLAAGRITAEHGMVLLRLNNDEQRRALHRRIIAEDLSVKEARRMGAEMSSRALRTPATSAQPSHLHWLALEDRFRAALGLKVGLTSGRGGRGRLTVEFANTEEMEHLLERLDGR